MTKTSNMTHTSGDGGRPSHGPFSRAAPVAVDPKLRDAGREGAVDGPALIRESSYEKKEAFRRFFASSYANFSSRASKKCECLKLVARPSALLCRIMLAAVMLRLKVRFG